MTQVICQAIDGMRLLGFWYEGLRRVVQPAALGPHADTGKMTLRAYQVGGATESGNVPFWRLFTLAKMTSVTLLDGTFQDPPPGYMRGDRDLARITCQL